MDFLDDIDFQIDCPECGKEITIHSNQVGKSVKCPFCKTDIQLKDGNFTKTLENADRQIKNLFKNF